MDQNTPVQPAPAKAPGSTILKVVGILMIIFGALSLIIGLAAGAVVGATSALADELGVTDAETTSALGSAGAYTAVLIVCAIVEFVAGIVGVALNNKPAKAVVCLVFGCLTIIVALVSFIMGIVSGATATNIISGLVGFVLPVLYFIGALKNKKAA